MAEPFLAIADADKIHEYVFSPRELKMIRGGSAIQVELNYHELPQLVHENGGEVIFQGGGTVLAEFPSEDAANAFCSHSQAKFVEKTGIATVTTAKASYDRTRFGDSLRRIRYSLERNKQEKREHLFTAGGSYWSNCQACGVFPAAGFARSDPSSLLCAACRLRERASKRGTGYGADIEPPEDFSSVGAFARPEGYLALIYIDLDRLGRHLADHAGSCKEDYKNISTLIDASVRMAVEESCQQLAVFSKEGNRYAGYEILLRGGDDAVFVVPAQCGLNVLERFGALYRRTYESANTGTPTPKFSAGMAIAHDHFPIADFLTVAEELLRSAKTLKEDSVDFAVIASSMTEQPLDERRSASRKDGLERTMRPYVLADLVDRKRQISKLKATAPASKVKALYRIAHEGKLQAELEYLDVLTRLDDRSAALLRPLIGQGDRGVGFWGQAASGRVGTHAADIVELWDFCEKSDDDQTDH